MASARNGPDERWVVEDVFRRVAATHPDLLTLHRPALRQVAHRTWCHAETMCRQGMMTPARAGLRASVRVWPAMAFDRRVWGLWLATWLGYDSFRKLRGWWHAAEGSR
jgi:hypothetical protein